MKNFKKLLLPAVLILVVVAGFLIFKFKSPRTLPAVSRETNYATLKIEGQAYDISDYVGKTALEATEAKISITTNGTGANAFITSIGGRSANTLKREFWEFDVNGVEAPIGAGSYIIKNHDEIKWKVANY